MPILNDGKTLKEEIKEKKSALMVEGRTPVDRAAEFSTLNYLLAYKAGDQENPRVKVPSSLPEKATGIFRYWSLSPGIGGRT